MKQADYCNIPNVEAKHKSPSRKANARHNFILITRNFITLARNKSHPSRFWHIIEHCTAPHGISLKEKWQHGICTIAKFTTFPNSKVPARSLHSGLNYKREWLFLSPSHLQHQHLHPKSKRLLVTQHNKQLLTKEWKKNYSSKTLEFWLSTHSK